MRGERKRGRRRGEGEDEGEMPGVTIGKRDNCHKRRRSPLMKMTWREKSQYFKTNSFISGNLFRDFTFWNLFLLLILSFNGQLLCAAGLPDPCETVGKLFHNSYPVLPSQYIACLKTFPFQPQQAKTILNIVWKTLIKIYPYTDIAIRSPDMRIYSQTRLRKQLKRIGNTTYKNDFEFHRDLEKVIDSLKDSHTAWTPQCFGGAIRTFNGIPMVQVFSQKKNRTVVKIAPLEVFEALSSGNFSFFFRATSSLLNISDVKILAGLEVKKIDGLETLKFIKLKAQKLGMYRNVHSRVNSLFIRPTFLLKSLFFGELMSPSIMPENDFMTLTVQRKNPSKLQNLRVPYFVNYYGIPFNGSTDYYENNCKVNKFPGFVFSNFEREPKIELNRSIKYNTPREIPEILPKNLKKTFSFAEFGSTENLKQLTSEFSVIQVYLLGDGKTAVMTVPDFHGTKPFGNEGLSDYLLKLQSGYDFVRKSGATRLIIDVTNNGGGYAATATLLTQFFFPNDKFPGFPIQFKANLFAQQEYERGSWSNKPWGSTYDYRSYVDVNGNLITNPENFFFPLQNVTHNNNTEPYSSLFKLPNLVNESITVVDIPEKPLFNESNILLLSNGLCYSTCAIFSYQMRQIHKVKVVTIGGRSNNGPFQMAEGAVGFVCDDYNNFYKSERLELVNTKPYVPPLLPIQGSLRFVLAQSFGPKSSKIPQEFIYEPGQFHLKYTDENVVSVERVWTEAAQFFE